MYQKLPIHSLDSLCNDNVVKYPKFAKICCNIDRRKHLTVEKDTGTILIKLSGIHTPYVHRNRPHNILEGRSYRKKCPGGVNHQEE
jgi:hypothetical protein